MSRIILFSQGLPDLLPMTGRSKTIHVSDIIKDLCLRLGHYEKSDSIDRTRMELGKALEWALIQRYQREFSKRYIIPGEIELDGIPGTPDLLDCLEDAVVEIKLTYRSGKGLCAVGETAPIDHPIQSDKFWRDRVQLQAYLKMLDMNLGFLEICHLMGNYNKGIQTVIHNVWRCEFTDGELNQNWSMILRHRDRMLKEGWTPNAT